MKIYSEKHPGNIYRNISILISKTRNLEFIPFSGLCILMDFSKLADVNYNFNSKTV